MVYASALWRRCGLWPRLCAVIEHFWRIFHGEIGGMPPCTQSVASRSFRAVTNLPGSLVAASQKKAAELTIWDFFECDSQLDRSKRLVLEGDKIYIALLKRKHPTNLKVHLRRWHKLANRDYLEQVPLVSVSSLTLMYCSQVSHSSSLRSHWAAFWVCACYQTYGESIYQSIYLSPFCYRKTPIFHFYWTVNLHFSINSVNGWSRWLKGHPDYIFR